ncbi:twin-arginine translocase subunit TatC [Paenisporosarcina cavernae]|uniref:Sec-independent protein translocase protein TatC n=1 Tax=Paenisporosarcina cavernae TaxID=2320858 RepID=A0A385YYV0_9BACL|nr:twin-arginine translocase subunit TatC [Paenisporosarcina cavernae]AYC30838.1 twin-arginine translocase subunit TatC [Paenisporosarcina cavernae]
MNQNELTLIEHIEEIRKRLMIIVVFFVVAFIGSFFVAKPIIHFLQFSEEAKQLTLHAFTITDPIMIYLKVIIVLSLVVTSPVILYQLWGFVSPGLYETERKATLSYIPFTFFLFVGGILFSYKVLFPFIVEYMILLSGDLGITQVIGINEYFNFLFQVTIPFGFIFQLPVVLLFLARLGLINPMTLSKIRKYAYFVLFVIAAFITPPDIFSHLLVTVPLFALYELSVFISRFGYRKYVLAEQKRELELASSGNEHAVESK